MSANGLIFSGEIVNDTSKSRLTPAGVWVGTASTGADTTPPTLSSPTAAATSSSTASGTVTTTESGGTLYYYVSTSSSATLATVLTGSSVSVTSTGVQSVSVSGLTASTSYYIHYAQVDASGNYSSVVSSASFVTSALSGVITSPPLKNNTGTVLASLTVSKVCVLRFSDMNLVLNLTNQTTDSSGVLTISSTSLVSGTNYIVVMSSSDGSSLGLFYGAATS